MEYAKVITQCIYKWHVIHHGAYLSSVRKIYEQYVNIGIGYIASA